MNYLQDCGVRWANTHTVKNRRLPCTRVVMNGTKNVADGSELECLCLEKIE